MYYFSEVVPPCSTGKDLSSFEGEGELTLSWHPQLIGVTHAKEEVNQRLEKIAKSWLEFLAKSKKAQSR